MITKDEVVKMQIDVKRRQQDLRDLETAYAIQECPFSIGDEVECLGYSHHGKKMVVEKISVPRWGSADWIVSGSILKKDGSKGLNEGKFTNKQYEAQNESPCDI